jgi:hypothetical protein
MNSKYSIFAKFGTCPVKVLRQMNVKKYYIIKEFIAEHNLSVKYKITHFRTMFLRTPLFSCEELILEFCPNILSRVIKYEDRIRLLSITCSCISFTTTCFGQTVRPSSGILQSHINSDQVCGLSYNKQ